MENLNLIRGVALSFSSSFCNIEYDDLFQEAALAYYIALPNYKDGKTTKTAYLYKCMKNALINYTNTAQRRIKVDNNVCERIQRVTFQKEWDCLLSYNFTGRMLEVIDIIFNDEQEDYNKPPKMCQGTLARKLRAEKGWKWVDIRDTLREMKMIVQNN